MIFSLSFILSRLISFYTLLIFVYVIMSWLPIKGGALLDVYRVLGTLCEPYLSLFRRILPTAAVGGAGLDFSPLVAILVLQIVGPLLVGLVARAGL